MEWQDAWNAKSFMTRFSLESEKRFSARTESMMHGDQKSVKQSEMSIDFLAETVSLT
jgi:hypothetical protein